MFDKDCKQRGRHAAQMSWLDAGTTSAWDFPIAGLDPHHLPFEAFLLHEPQLSECLLE